ncbi:MAG: XdhC/CoxI family protein [Synergistota bacterium]|nr:XdhC/CoxI family protein [Synergistota bacterium]
MNGDLLKIINNDVSSGKCGVLCTVIKVGGSAPRGPGTSMWISGDGKTSGTIGGGPAEHEAMAEAACMISEGTETKMLEKDLGPDGSGMICGGSMTLFLQVLGREEKLIVFGAGHVGKAIARLGVFAGMHVTVWDDRAEFANSENLPGCEPVACSLEEAFSARLVFSDRTCVVVCTRAHEMDSDVLAALDGCPMAYVGMLGSRRKISAIRENLLKQGVSAHFLDRVFQPIGVPIEADTPEEIALSIMAEIIAVLRGASVETLRTPYEKG